MSDIEIIARIYELLEAADLDGLLTLASADCVITQDECLPWGGRFVGHDGVSSFMVGLYGTIESTLTTDALFESDGQVIQVGRSRGSVRANHAAFDLPEVHTWTVEDGLVTTAHFASDTAAMCRALAGVG